MRVWISGDGLGTAIGRSSSDVEKRRRIVLAAAGMDGMGWWNGGVRVATKRWLCDSCCRRAGHRSIAAVVLCCGTVAKLLVWCCVAAQLPRSVMCCQVTETEKKCDKNRMTHSVHGAGLGVEGGKVSEPPRTLAMEVYYNGEVPGK